MARIRTIKPEFWTDEKIVECSFEARLMFIGMFNFADDKGNLVREAYQDADFPCGHDRLRAVN
jgi:hypothetical protein